MAMRNKINVVIIGGGISGCVTALKLLKKYKNNINIVLYEKREKLLGGLPFCHLHAGGMLYPMISIKECESLLYHSLLFAQEFSESINNIPTVVAYRKESKYDPNKLILKCKIMKYNYSLFCNKNKSKLLGDPDTYYQVYDRQDVIAIKNNNFIKKNEYHDRYVKEFVKILDNIDDIKYPFVSVREHSISMDKMKNLVISRLNEYDNIKVLYNTMFNGNENVNYDYIINAAGCNIDEINRREDKNVDYFLEFKASWIINNKFINVELPEIAIIGERNTERGMIQISPMESSIGRVYQIHCMMSNVTLFKDGILYNKTTKDFPIELRRVIERDTFDNKTIIKRTRNAIKEISKVFSIFDKSEIIMAPMWGVQRIAGNDKSKRSNDIIVDGNYIEICIVKGVSSVYAADKICEIIK